MTEFLKHFAFGTFALQIVLFAVPLLASLYFCLYGLWVVIRAAFFETEEERAKYLAGKEKKEEALRKAKKRGKRATGPTTDLPALKPLKCSSCGAGVPLHAVRMTCPHCGNSFPVPQEYGQIGRLRDKAVRKLRRATRYWRLAGIVTSKWTGRTFIAAAIWLAAVIPILVILESHSGLGYYEELIEGHQTFFMIGIFTLLFWVAILSITAFYVTPRARKALPVLEFGENLGKVEDTECSQCGGAIRYEKPDLAAVCGYCGVETYRAKLAWERRGIANDARHSANFSLVESNEEFSEAVFDISFIPMVIISMFITAPFLMLVLPSYLYAYVRDEHPLLGIGFIAVAAVAIAARIYRKEVFGFFTRQK